MTSIKDQIRAEIDKLYGEYKDKFHQSGDQYHLGLIDGLDMAERVLDTLPEQPVEGLEEEIATWIPAHISGGDDEVWKDTKNAVTEWAGIVARHFAEWQKAKMLKLIETRISEIVGDAQPNPVLRIELQGIIDKIK